MGGWTKNRAPCKALSGPIIDVGTYMATFGSSLCCSIYVNLRNLLTFM